jgi:predicted transglutaminase-like protease
MEKDMKIFKVLEVTNEFNNSSSYTVSCVVKNMLTGEIISINQENASGLELKIIDKVDNFDLNENDEFIIRD